jgi:hypothetical protein
MVGTTMIEKRTRKIQQREEVEHKEKPELRMVLS